MTTTTRFVALYHGNPIGTYDSRDAAAGACQDAALEAKADEDEARQMTSDTNSGCSVVSKNGVVIACRDWNKSRLSHA